MQPQTIKESKKEAKSLGGQQANFPIIFQVLVQERNIQSKRDTKYDKYAM